MTNEQEAGIATGDAPSLARRLAALAYEGVLVFGLVVAVGLLYGGLTQQRHALVGQFGLQAWIFLALGCYFVCFWAWQGQTLAMRTWRIRVERLDGRRLSVPQACARYLLSWMWFVPALLALRMSGLQGPVPFAVLVLTGILAYGALCRLHPARQFLHDVLCRSRLVEAQAPETSGARTISSR